VLRNRYSQQNPINSLNNKLPSSNTQLLSSDFKLRRRETVIFFTLASDLLLLFVCKLRMIIQTLKTQTHSDILSLSRSLCLSTTVVSLGVPTINEIVISSSPSHLFNLFCGYRLMHLPSQLHNVELVDPPSWKLVRLISRYCGIYLW